MHFSTLLLLPATVAALDAASRSLPFHLSIRSDNDTYNEKAVSACHQGASLTSLCITDQAVNLTQPGAFALNTITNNETGVLEFNAPTPSTSEEEASDAASTALSNWFPMSFKWDAYTNIVMGFFAPPLASNTTQTVEPSDLTFQTVEEEGDFLVMLPPVMDDRDAPDWKPVPLNETVSRWFVCETWAPGAYRRTSIVWGLGETQPQNPTCVKVDVVRVTG